MWTEDCCEHDEIWHEDEIEHVCLLCSGIVDERTGRLTPEAGARVKAEALAQPTEGQESEFMSDHDESDSYELAGTLENARYWHRRAEAAEAEVERLRAERGELRRMLGWRAQPTEGQERCPNVNCEDGTLVFTRVVGRERTKERYPCRWPGHTEGQERE